MSVKVQAPASSANLGPGFDVLGLALALYNTIELDVGRSEMELVVMGEGRGIVDRRPADNLAVRSIRRFYERLGDEVPPLKIAMDNRIPLARGLGSSAATIVGALTAANALHGAGLSKDRLFDLAVEIEGHADNVAAAVHGGLTIAYREDDRYTVRRCRLSECVGIVVLVPEAGLSTAEARAALPHEVSREAAVFNIGRVSLLIESLLTGDFTVMAAALQDALHQPWRQGLIADYDQVVDTCMEAGAKGVALSGAGPTMIAFYDRQKQAPFEKALHEVIAANDLRRRPNFLTVDPNGARLA